MKSFEQEQDDGCISEVKPETDTRCHQYQMTNFLMVKEPLNSEFHFMDKGFTSSLLFCALVSVDGMKRNKKNQYSRDEILAMEVADEKPKKKSKKGAESDESADNETTD